MAKRKYEADIELGKVYRDEQTGFEGTATVLSFFQHGCERVVLESKINNDGKVIQEAFDVPRLVEVSTGKRASTSRPGGPGHPMATERQGAATR